MYLVCIWKSCMCERDDVSCFEFSNSSEIRADASLFCSSSVPRKGSREDWCSRSHAHVPRRSAFFAFFDSFSVSLSKFCGNGIAMRPLQCCNSWYIQHDASILDDPTIITDSELQLPSPIFVNLPQLLRKYHRPFKLPITLPTSLHPYTCSPIADACFITWRCHQSLFVDTGPRTNALLFALKVAEWWFVIGLVVRKLCHFVFRLVAAVNCWCLGTE